MSDIIKCNRCGTVLMRGNGCAFFGAGASIGCKVCGAEVTLDDPIVVNGDSSEVKEDE